MTRIGIIELGYRCCHKESSRLSEIELKKRTEDGLKDIVDLHKGVASAGWPPSLPAQPTPASVQAGCWP